MSDLIKREDAIKALRERWARTISYDGIGEDIGEECEDVIKAVPSADRPQEWISCSERLPEIGQKVLVSTKKTVFTQVFKGYYSDPKRWAWENNRVKEIEAWQPIPKPWKGADDEADNNQFE